MRTPSEQRQFRTGNTLTTRFTGTLTERHGKPHEHIPTSRDLLEWLRLNELSVTTCTDAEVRLAHDLRESLHAALTAVASGQDIPQQDRTRINRTSAHCRASAMISAEGMRVWVLRTEHELADALGVIATDAIDILAGQRPGRLARCSSPTCQAVFLDTSRGHTRRWCDMNSCGNKQKKLRFRGTT